jgi:hypothetical protein
MITATTKEAIWIHLSKQMMGRKQNWQEKDLLACEKLKWLFVCKGDILVLGYCLHCYSHSSLQKARWSFEGAVFSRQQIKQDAQEPKHKCKAIGFQDVSWKWKFQSLHSEFNIKNSIPAG